MKAKERVYISKFTQPIAEVQAEVKALTDKRAELAERIRTIKVGDQCPSCLTQVTDVNLEAVKGNLIAEYNRIGVLGRGAIARGKELTELDRQSREAHEQFKAEDVRKYTAELDQLSKEAQKADPVHLRGRISQFDQFLKYGNLSEDEYSELQRLQTELDGVAARITAAEELSSDRQLKAMMEEKDAQMQRITKYRDVISGLTEFICKRTELATADLAMPNVSIMLYDVVRTTGEAKSAFKFAYKGREYHTLSLSEKTLAGIEIAAMMRKITGRDYPVCIDNTESIAALNSDEMPSQVMLLRFVKGQPLTVKSVSRAPQKTDSGSKTGKAA